MPPNFPFLPQSVDALSAIDARMRAKLAASIDYLVTLEPLASDPVIDLSSLHEAIVDRRQHPGVFGRYFDLVLALRASQRDKAVALLRDLDSLAREGISFEVKPFSEAAMGEDAARYARMLEGGEAPIFATPGPKDWCSFDARVDDAFVELELTDAILAAEVRALLVEIIGTVPRPAARDFGSVSSLTLWGAAVFNLRRHQTGRDLIGGLVHEAAHQLLFGYAIEHPLVFNPDSERYSSPLRSDPRPMDGVVHATFVCGRLHLLYTGLLASGRLTSPDSVADTRSRLAQARACFDDGITTIRQHAKLTEVGSEVIDNACAYMADAA